MELEDKEEGRARLAIAGVGWASPEGDGVLDLDVSIYSGQFASRSGEEGATAPGQRDEVALLRKALREARDDALRHQDPDPDKADERHTLLLVPEGSAPEAAAELSSEPVTSPLGKEDFDGESGNRGITGKDACVETVTPGPSFLLDALSRAERAFERGEADMVLVASAGQWPLGKGPVEQGAGEREGVKRDAGERNRIPVAMAVALRRAAGSERGQDYAILARSDDPFGSAVQALPLREAHEGHDLPVGSLKSNGQVGLEAVVLGEDEPAGRILEEPSAERPCPAETRRWDRSAHAWPPASGSAETAEGGEHARALLPVLAADGVSFPLASLMALSEVALALAHGYLPGVAAWLRSEMGKFVPADSPALFPDSSRPWFASPARPRRMAELFLPTALQDGQNEPTQAGGFVPDAVFKGSQHPPTEVERDSGLGITGVMGRAGSEGHQMAWGSWTVAEGGLQKGRFGDVIRRANWHLFPLVGQDTQEILVEADSLRHGLEMGAKLSVLSRRAFQILQRSKASDKVAVLLAKSPEELDKEIARALAGVSAAEQKGNLWQTPNGSAFAARPMGAEAKVAFVYPGGFNSYPQIGRDLFFWFPGLYESMAPITGDLGLALNEELLYPWGEGDEDPGGIRPLKPELSDDPVAMLTSGTTLSILYTQIMEGTFGVAPSAAFGYSLGENSMLFSSGVWRNGDEMVRALTESEVFKTELAGPQRTVKRSWGWTDGGDGPVWSNFLLMAPAERVQDALEREKRVYLTHVNSPGQVMVGGERAACLRVANELGCRALEASFNVALHCRVVEVQREALRVLHDWPVQGHPDAQLFSAAKYGPLAIERQAIASSMAQMLVSPLDFVRLVETVYGEGARVFVELGAGSNCSRWIDETLKEEPHVAVSINHRGVDDLQGVLRVAARLISEKVPIRLDAFV